MSNARTELFAYLGAAFATCIGLFVLYYWYGSFIDQRYNAQLAAHGPSQASVEAREADAKKLAAGKMPLDEAMQRLAQRGRGSFASIAPEPSDDLSAVAGWIHRPEFKPVVAHPIWTAHRPKPVAAPAAPQAPPAAPAEPAAPAPQKVKKPAPAKGKAKH